jgi:hypothetical protein
MVHWLIRKGKEKEFIARWHGMTVDNHSGLYREILTTIDKGPEDDKFHTFSIGDPFYSTYVNIGIWKSVKHFDEAIGKYIPKTKVTTKKGRKVYAIQIDAYEFKMRERVVLKVISDRGSKLPPARIPFDEPIPLKNNSKRRKLKN